MPKTVVIWDSCDADIQFFVTEKNVDHLHKKYCNSCNISEDESNEISLLMYDDNGQKVIETTTEFPLQEVLDGAKVVVMGFLP